MGPPDYCKNTNLIYSNLAFSVVNCCVGGKFNSGVYNTTTTVK